MRIVIVTGMSGAGKSSVLNLFEDMGYYCMDNLPPQLLTNFIDLVTSSRQHIEKIAVGVDLRGGSFFDALKDTTGRLMEEQHKVSILFLDARDEVLVRRYKELRRPHPLDKAGNIFDGIQRERLQLKEIRRLSDHVLDTSGFTLGQLKRSIDKLYLAEGDAHSFLINVTSFGYKYGILLDADLVIDTRFIPNPYYELDLRPFTGLDQPVKDFIFQFDETKEFLQQTKSYLHFLIPLYIREGKRLLSIGIGCTGGKHRSVALAEAIGSLLKEEYSSVVISHRDREHWR